MGKRLTSFALSLILLQACNPPQIDGRFIFYLHGGVVQSQGAEAISAYYGKYEYYAILDSLARDGFTVISEVRPKDTQEEDYAHKLIRQIDSLESKGVSRNQITVVGASLGAYIAVELAHLLQDPEMKYVLLGLCSPYAVDHYQKYASEICGNFLSFYESSDQKQSCLEVFNKSSCNLKFEEVRLDMGIDHAFLFKPYPAWVDPLFDWIKRQH